MIVKLKGQNTNYPDIDPDEQYFVIGIEADDYRILNDSGKPYLYSPDLFEIVDQREPLCWITEYGEEGERYAYPPILNEVGFFEDYFDGKERAITDFWHVINKQLSELRSEPVSARQREVKTGKLLDLAAELVQEQAALKPMSTTQIRFLLVHTFSILQKLQMTEDKRLSPDNAVKSGRKPKSREAV
ncbi:MAG: hypothetical protein ACP5SH_06765 [Syntrophobacteraceae bacterium]